MDHIVQKTKPLNTEFENIFEQDQKMLYNKARRYEASTVKGVKEEQHMEVSYFSTFVVFIFYR